MAQSLVHFPETIEAFCENLKPIGCELLKEHLYKRSLDFNIQDKLFESQSLPRLINYCYKN